MAKRKQNSSRTIGSPPAPASGGPIGPIVTGPPAKSPSLLAVSIVLFALWFVFLLFAAIWQ
ncbi:MAG: hypothetical protein L0211_16130 [Planctomycetaceae bacterium]|nr:hypothetical protein [Planctomycetaceae bacterium]